MDTEWAPALTINGVTSYEAKRECKIGFERTLERMDGENLHSLVLWHYPADEEFASSDYLDQYLQCAGTAERLTIEFRYTRSDGTYVHFVLCRGEPEGDEASAIHPRHPCCQVYAEVVWIAAEAARIFDSYTHEVMVPGCVLGREVKM
ncbi:hypothetical protein [Dermabacter hominis]|uniref:hypothetical protein n=1 Tax=Dermabacter hominis TaxID=36740 RepID=UPI00242C4262|nr:hypothetical protein [Dermabacter hominis]